MNESVPTSPVPRHGAWILWLIWIAATCLGPLAIGLLLAISDIVALKLVGSGVLLLLVLPLATPLLSGAAQHFALRVILPGENRWCRETSVGALIGLVAGPLLFLFVSFLGVVFVGSWHHYDTGWVIAAGIGLLIGLLVPPAACQRRVLRQHSQHSGWWLLTYPLGWSTSMIVAVATLAALGGVREAVATLAAWGGMREGVSEIAIIIAVSLVMGVFVGGITGATLLYILRAGPIPRQPGRRTAADWLSQRVSQRRRPA
jgi:hypothetical protein